MGEHHALTHYERPTISGDDVDLTPAFNRPAYWYIRETDNFPTTVVAARDPDPLFRVKLFDPQEVGPGISPGYDPATRIAFGAVDGWE
ncbi:MAG: hypothetical protein HY262_09560 [Chloroflexi bacterium]|nr:hypothetical protein [Chloroflexota bacterium]